MSPSALEVVPNLVDRLVPEELRCARSRSKLAFILEHEPSERERESLLRTIPHFAWKRLGKRLYQERLVDVARELRRVRKSVHGFDEPMIEKRHPRFDGVRHAHRVGIAQQLVLQVMIELEAHRCLY